MRIYLNSGQDVETPEQMKNAKESSSGMPGVRVMQHTEYSQVCPCEMGRVLALSITLNMAMREREFGGHMRFDQVNSCCGVRLISQKTTLFQC